MLPHQVVLCESYPSLCGLSFSGKVLGGGGGAHTQAKTGLSTWYLKRVLVGCKGKEASPPRILIWERCDWLSCGFP